MSNPEKVPAKIKKENKKEGKVKKKKEEGNVVAVGPLSKDAKRGRKKEKTSASKLAKLHFIQTRQRANSKAASKLSERRGEAV